MTLNALEGKPLPVYGDGCQVRDWLHVEDHCRGIMLALERGRMGEVYNFGGYGERFNIDIVKAILEHTGADESLIRYVTDRPGHDRRYAINPHKSSSELGWQPLHSVEEGLAATVDWYRTNATWCESVRSGAYMEYYAKHYGTSL
jgi:dTDP-glucose 4,6-dehydratase